MGTKVTVRRTATKKAGNTKGTVKTTTKTTVDPKKISTSKTRTVSKKGKPSVSYVKGS